MKIAVGLGNPDKEYNNTFHNLGFAVIDKTAEILGVEIKKEKFRSLIAETVINGEKVILAKPLTYMNLSGEAVKEIVDFYKIDYKDLVVVYDDYDLIKGEIRIRESGSSGTHNGMRNVIKELKTENFARMRIGFKQDGENNIPLINLVLSGIPKKDEQLFNKAISNCALAVKDFVFGETISKIMQKYNGK